MAHMDMHVHSVVSPDGEISPHGLAELCRQEGVTLAALTDHNAVSGVPEFSWRGAQLGVRVIPGIELDCMLDGLQLHILGYGIDIANEAIQMIEKSARKTLQAVSEQQMDAVMRQGILFDRSTVLEKARDGVITAEMIAEAALREPKNKVHPLIRPLLPGGARADRPLVNFYWDVCAPGKAAYIPIPYITAEQAIQTIHAAGGIAVLAHPMVNIGMQTEPLKQLIAFSLDGIEVFSSYHSSQAAAFYLDLAEEHRLLMTGGSDFHGSTKPDIRLGAIDFMGREDALRTAVLSALF